MRYFCTYFDRYYLLRGLALYQSLKRYCPSFRLWILCMDRECYDALANLRLDEAYLILLEDLEKSDEQLAGTKPSRTPIEYYFTCTPSLPLFIFANFNEVDLITYLDADILFFADPAPIFDEIGNRSIAIIEHRFHHSLRYLMECGIYNVSWLSFRRDENGFSCLRWWRQRCIEWCYDRAENGRYADQKYLDDWPARFKNLIVLQHKGANLALWNLANYKIHRKGKSVWVDEQPLIFFHFHMLDQMNKWLYHPNLERGNVRPSRIILGDIYLPYIRSLSKMAEKVSPLFHNQHIHNGIRYPRPKPPLPEHVFLTRRILRRARESCDMCKGIVSGKYILFIG